MRCWRWLFGNKIPISLSGIKLRVSSLYLVNSTPRLRFGFLISGFWFWDYILVGACRIWDLELGGWDLGFVLEGLYLVTCMPVLARWTRVLLFSVGFGICKIWDSELGVWDVGFGLEGLYLVTCTPVLARRTWS